MDCFFFFFFKSNLKVQVSSLFGNVKLFRLVGGIQSARGGLAGVQVEASGESTWGQPGNGPRVASLACLPVRWPREPSVRSRQRPELSWA